MADGTASEATRRDGHRFAADLYREAHEQQQHEQQQHEQQQHEQQQHEQQQQS